ncbi:hypothetical protein WN51_07386 [Melipona quadrifasciata]|uniref:Uncharacterized protein n=1 Tax=Melipona quadrifasciata TaxID=166423 RepID=A0A0M8ZNU2_9HYME|nr:hypothetical protein WN51_07386 [Melipona quadrifasciata]
MGAMIIARDSVDKRKDSVAALSLIELGHVSFAVLGQQTTEEPLPSYALGNWDDADDNDVAKQLQPRAKRCRVSYLLIKTMVQFGKLEEFSLMKSETTTKCSLRTLRPLTNSQVHSGVLETKHDIYCNIRDGIKSSTIHCTFVYLDTFELLQSVCHPLVKVSRLIQSGEVIMAKRKMGARWPQLSFVRKVRRSVIPKTSTPKDSKDIIPRQREMNRTTPKGTKRERVCEVPKILTIPISGGSERKKFTILLSVSSEIIFQRYNSKLYLKETSASIFCQTVKIFLIARLYCHQ